MSGHGCVATVTDAHLTEALSATFGTPAGMYEQHKMAAYLRLQGHRVPACTVDRLMRDEGLSGGVVGHVLGSTDGA